MHNEVPLSYKNEVLPFGRTQINLEIIMLREISQAQKAKGHMSSLICGV
jgi:hypothetical protein